MKPQPAYQVYLYPQLAAIGSQCDPDSFSPPPVLSFFFERTSNPGEYRYACGKCQMVAARGYFVSSPFFCSDDLPGDVCEEIAQHARSHQIIGAAECRGFVMIPHKELENLKSLVSALGG